MNPDTGQLQNLSKINFNLSVVKGPDVKVRAFFIVKIYSEKFRFIPLSPPSGRGRP